MRIAVYASGNGSNFQAIAEAIASKQVDATICFLFCDNPKAYVIERAKKLGVPFKVFSPRNYENRAAYERELLNQLELHAVDLIVLAGYMRIIGPTLLRAYANRILNIHPSLLPSFPGKSSIQDAFDANEKETGVTVHVVDAGVDTGPIIAQEKVIILPEDTLDSLEDRIHQVEHRLFPQVIQKVIENKTFKKSE
ncbi:phosphoribosylglycinamide formyltransferase [Carnobacterium viridans]|uniref:Phosphoribosylglycinamide formyltransferase n=1 Tax=Carnobacterium viridans TaxID=174587 RepID=A0A1H0ZQK4_9LACT|nr:phosphoribosylglycinamide formyltransferase [Carnobacterium viridans]UDE94514.1 phosphoribosylglycinamide formyltransferase [Carnobacterium viridans]SDQ29667.1 formyltetrahydrofolate-dependent phosphoribosylglycinamide formyltransferase [Carnobacterium viridans]